MTVKRLLHCRMSREEKLHVVLRTCSASKSMVDMAFETAQPSLCALEIIAVDMVLAIAGVLLRLNKTNRV